MNVADKSLTFFNSLTFQDLTVVVFFVAYFSCFVALRYSLKLVQLFDWSFGFVVSQLASAGFWTIARSRRSWPEKSNVDLTG